LIPADTLKEIHAHLIETHKKMTFKKYSSLVTNNLFFINKYKADNGSVQIEYYKLKSNGDLTGLTSIQFEPQDLFEPVNSRFCIFRTKISPMFKISSEGEFLEILADNFNNEAVGFESQFLDVQVPNVFSSLKSLAATYLAH